MFEELRSARLHCFRLIVTMEGHVRMLLKSSSKMVDNSFVSRMALITVTSLPIWGRGFAATTSTTAKAKTKVRAILLFLHICCQLPPSL